MLALCEIKHDPLYADVEITVLVTFGPPAAFVEEEEEEEVNRTKHEEEEEGDNKAESSKKKKKKTFLAHPLRVIKLQAQALGLPHVVLPIEGPDYLASYVEAIRGLMQTHQLTHLVTGDILDVCQQFMEKATHGAGGTILRPLWERPRLGASFFFLLLLHPATHPRTHLSHPPTYSIHTELLKKMESFTFLLSCCNLEKMGRRRAEAYTGLCGALAYQELCCLADRNERKRKEEEEEEGEEEEEEIDACGEGGEYHSMVGLVCVVYVGRRRRRKNVSAIIQSPPFPSIHTPIKPTQSPTHLLFPTPKNKRCWTCLSSHKGG